MSDPTGPWGSFDDYLASGGIDPNYPGYLQQPPPPSTVSPEPGWEAVAPGMDERAGPFLYSGPSTGFLLLDAPPIGSQVQSDIWQQVWPPNSKTYSFMLVAPRGTFWSGIGEQILAPPPPPPAPIPPAPTPPPSPQPPPTPPLPLGTLETVLAVAGTTLMGHQVVTLTVSGTAVYADCTNTAEATRPLLLTLTGVASGIQAEFLAGGRVDDPSWDWDPTHPVWLGTNGALTQIPPNTPGTFVVQVATVISPTAILFGPQTPVILAG